MPSINTKHIDRRTRIGLLAIVASYIVSFYLNEIGKYYCSIGIGDMIATSDFGTYCVNGWIEAGGYTWAIGALVGLGIIAHGYKDHQLIKDLVTGFILGCIIDEIRYDPSNELPLWPTMLLSVVFGAVGAVVRSYRQKIEKGIAAMAIATAIKMLMLWLWKLAVSVFT